MKLNYLTESELEMSREEVNLQIALGLESCEIKEDVCQLLDDVRAHERHEIEALQKASRDYENLQKLKSIEDMGVLYDKLKKIPWYRFSERRAQMQKIEELRIKQRGW